ncbi:glycosyltransferase family 4 protein [Methanobacterium paludis]|uniref:Glycosyl transferase group 1 n=1 Tax=Methanobacterium paludis (strain DSM 25820 / JCM 18151 / SWAN1) TaxID=868131 RepID=F6D6Z1_METPW|nr:glycosyltransferase family 4 protein [Methanobacterium paludis]AEG18358.1 glycosyl transferase group 1 [Methanobacterium paludis]
MEKIFVENGLNTSNPMNVVLVADVDLSRFSGDTVRTMAFASELTAKGLHVTLITPEPSENKLMFQDQGIYLKYLDIKQKKGSLVNILSRNYKLIKKVKELKTDDSVLVIEMGLLGGYFAFLGFDNYFLDVHGMYFDEVAHAKVPWYIPHKILKFAVKHLESAGLKNASKIVVVSDSMKNLVVNEFKISSDKIEVISNGYFGYKVLNTFKKDIKIKKGRVTFVGTLSKWASVDKIIKAARNLKNENVEFCIVGDGNCFIELKELAKKFKLENVLFTGYLSIDKVYETVLSSEIVLLPFNRDLCTEVASPIKVFEYMAFGKALVLDEVSDITRFLKDNNAALVSDPADEAQFTNNIRILLKDKELRDKIGFKALNLSKEFSWESQVEKLFKLILHEQKSK